jgi:hypothetical protein
MINQTKPRPKTADASHIVSDFTGNKYPGSLSADWTIYKGYGMVHRSELSSFKRYHTECKVSHKWIRTDDAATTIDGLLVDSEEAIKAGYWRCEYTGYYARPDQEKLIAHNHICPFKAIEVSPNYLKDMEVCKVTGKRFIAAYYESVFSNRLMIEVRISPEYSYMLQKALENGETPEYIKCGHCGRWHASAEMSFRDGFGWICNSCWDRVIEQRAVRRHDDKNYCKPILHKEKRWLTKGGEPKSVDVQNPRMMGVELECGFSHKDGRAKVAANITKVLGDDWIFVKHDGSIVQNDTSLAHGIEIVSAPANIEIHRERWLKLEDSPYFKHLRAWDTKSCGMHVHVSRDSLTALQIGRIAHFVGHDDNQKFIRKVSGRTCEQYAKLQSLPITSGIRKIGGKYEGIRLNLEETIEFRIFRGTIRYRHIIRNLEFVNAICDFCSPAARSFAEARNHNEFLQFIANSRSQYPLFAEWCEVQEMIPRRRLKPGEKPVEVEEAHEPGTEALDKDGQMVDGQIPPPGAGIQWDQIVFAPPREARAWAELRLADIQDEGFGVAIPEEDDDEEGEE